MRLSGSELRTARTAYTFLLPTILILGLFQFYPMVQAFALAFRDYSPMYGQDQWVGAANFARLWGDQAFWQALVNSFLYLLVVPVVIGLALLLALLVEPELPGIDFFRASFYVPVVTMMVVVAFVWKLLFNTDYGLINEGLEAIGVLGLLQRARIISGGVPWLTDAGIALYTIMSVTVWKGLGYYMVMFIVGLKAVPKSLIEAARIDGARGWDVFLHVKLPAVWPIVVLTSVLSSISALQVFEEIYVMTLGRTETATIVYQIYETGFDIQRGTMEMGYACAMGVVLFGILLAFSILAIYLMERVYRT